MMKEARFTLLRMNTWVGGGAFLASLITVLATSHSSIAMAIVVFVSLLLLDLSGLLPLERGMGAASFIAMALAIALAASFVELLVDPQIGLGPALRLPSVLASAVAVVVNYATVVGWLSFLGLGLAMTHWYRHSRGLWLVWLNLPGTLLWGYLSSLRLVEMLPTA